MLKPFSVLSLSTVFALSPVYGLAAPVADQPESLMAAPSAEAMLVDGLIYRPLYLASTVLGTGVFIVTLPFSAAGGNVRDAGERLVLEPAREAFSRCLGCLPQDSY